jgi:hypothetical protein
MEFNIKSLYSNHEIEVNGALADSIWEKTRPVEMVNNGDGTNTKETYKALIRSCWTENNLYFALEAGYEELFLAPKDAETDPKSGKTFRLWDISDVFEVFIGPYAKQNRVYREFQVSPDSRWIDLAIDASGKERTGDFGWLSGMKAKSTIDYVAKKWYSVLQFPFAAFDTLPKEKDVWNLNFYRMAGTPENRLYFAWSPTFMVQFHKPEKFGNITFVK